MVTQELIDYIKQSLDHGALKETIKNSLMQQGWAEADVEGGFVEAQSGTPVPMPSNFQYDGGSTNYNNPVSLHDEGHNSALHFFLYLVSFLSLLFVATGLGAILYQIVNKLFPDTEVGYSYFNLFSQGAIKFGLASIIIATPVYFILSFLITKYLFEGKIRQDSKVRKWTTYIVLFNASAIILGDLISLVYNMLGGDMAARFVLKTLVVILIAGSIFGYYFWDMRKKNIVGKKYFGNKLALLASLGVIVIVFVSSFFIVDSPTESRNKQIDSTVTSQMQNYTYSVSSYYQKNKALPANLSDLDSSGFGSNGQSNGIVYKKTGDFTYQLCADFKTANLLDDKNNPYSYGSSSDKWKHDKGNKCFNQEIDKGMRTTQTNSAYVQPFVSPDNTN